MNDTAKAKLERVQKLLGVIATAEGEIEELLGEASATLSVAVRKYTKRQPGVAPSAKKGERLCGGCRKPGHQARTCSQNTPENYGFKKEPESPLPAGRDEHLADAIREEWGEGGRSSVDVCRELAITLGKFNYLVEKVQNRSVVVVSHFVRSASPFPAVPRVDLRHRNY